MDERYIRISSRSYEKRSGSTMNLSWRRGRRKGRGSGIEVVNFLGERKTAKQYLAFIVLPGKYCLSYRASAAPTFY